MENDERGYAKQGSDAVGKLSRVRGRRDGGEAGEVRKWA